MTLQLCLIAINPTTLTDKDSGEKTVRFKYIFVSELNKPYVGWSDTRILEDRLCSSDSFQPARAYAYEVSADTWNDKLTYKVRLDQ